MSIHKYAVGDRVTATADSANKHFRAGVYTITKVLPVAGQGCQYRAKNPLDAHERVLDEYLLRSAGS